VYRTSVREVVGVFTVLFVYAVSFLASGTGTPMATGLGTSTYNTPRARTFSELKRDVASYVMMPDQGEALVAAGVGLNNAIRKLNARAWKWSITYTDITLAAGTYDYTLPNDFKDVYAMSYLDTSGNPSDHLGYMQAKEFEQTFKSSAVQVSPSVATVINAKSSLILSLNYAPNADFIASKPTARVRYFKRLPILVSESDRPDVYGEVENFLTWSGRTYVSSIYDPAKMKHAQLETAMAFQDLVADDNETGYRDWPEDY